MNFSCREGHEAVAAFLRGEPLPAVSEWLSHTRVALVDLYEIKQDEFAQEIAEADDARARWVQRHPELQPPLDPHEGTVGTRE